MLRSISEYQLSDNFISRLASRSRVTLHFRTIAQNDIKTNLTDGHLLLLSTNRNPFRFAVQSELSLVRSALCYTCKFFKFQNSALTVTFVCTVTGNIYRSFEFR